MISSGIAEIVVIKYKQYSDKYEDADEVFSIKCFYSNDL